MIVGVDARAAAEVVAGRGRVVRELLEGLDAIAQPHRFLLYCREPWRGAALGSRFEWVPVSLPDPLWHVATAARATRACDVFLSTNSYLTGWMLRIPCVVVVHDLIPLLPDIPANAGAARIERATIGPAVRRAARLVCNSESTENDLIRHFPRALGRTAVVPFAASSRFHTRFTPAELEATARRYRVEAGRYVLATGTLEPRKNLVRLIRAHNLLPEDLRRRNPLLIVGPRGWEEQATIDEAGDSGHVRLAGYVPDADLPALYSACAVFCFPSLYEGFGLPVLEAMAAGAAVVSSDASSLPEVGGDAVAYVSPRDERAIAGALERLLRAPTERAELGMRARRRASGFSWQRAGREILDQLEAAADNGG